MHKYAWRRIRPENAIVSRSSHGVSVIGSVAYVFGGEHEPRTPFDSRVHSLKLDADVPKWEVMRVKGGTPPALRLAHAQTKIDDTIYIFGGRQSVSMEEAPLNDLHAFNVKTSCWDDLSTDTTEQPCPRSFHKIVSVRRKIYLFGGCSALGRLNDLWCLDTETGGWEELPSSKNIAGRGGAGFFSSADEQSLFVVGGFVGKEANDIHRYDIAARSWSCIQQDGDNHSIRPFSVSCGGILNNAAAVFFGGEVGESAKGHEGAGSFSNGCLALDANTCSIISDFSVIGPSRAQPEARGWADADIWGGDKLVVGGGLTGDDSNPKRLNDVWVLEPFK